MKSRIPMLLAGLLASALAQAAPVCPSRDFAMFFKAFAEDAQLQADFTAHTLVEQRLQAGPEGPQPVVRKLEPALRPDLSQLSSERVAANGLIREIALPDRVYLRDQRGEVLQAFIFEQADCWALARVEDWSPSDALKSVKTPDDAAPGVRALLRGDAYEQLGQGEIKPIDKQLFIAALNSYLDAVDQGSAYAAYSAAAISLSGMAPRLSNQRLEQLLRLSSATVPEGALMLASFYCDEGQYRPDDNTCKHPQKALDALRQSAAMGSGNAFNELGSVYARGEIVPAQPARSLACYTEAVAHGADWADFNAQEMIKRGARADKDQPCL
ncbi:MULTISPECIES: sel1 repeat family protein [Pseudomonas]|uniref:sel1 repeat family protein n=1 Tax=Pseudomonas TaxID=286 RepID=UPI002E173661|nr:sel1 repeat family protein [Pseudomonas qingdaonensis]